METPLRIDVDKVIEKKSPKAAKMVPCFVKNYLKRVIHQDEINQMLQLYGHLRGAECLRAVFSHLEITYSSSGLDTLDKNGRYLFASNHPFGGMDGMMLLDELHRYFGDGKAIANDLLMNVVPLESLFIPINKHGSQSRATASQMDQVLNSDIPVATFPAGLCSRCIDGRIVDLDWKPNFVKKALETRRDIVPVYFEGRLSNFFYRLSKIRKALGVKFNIEMLYLADELFAQRGGNFTIRFGTPIPHQQIASMGTPREVTAKVREMVYQMAENC